MMEHLIEPRMPEEIALSEGTLMGATSDPDAQATVSDFIDYTEYLPADLQRSLILIGKLDERYLEAAQAVHELTREYGALPTIPEADRTDPVVLRKRISKQLFRAISARECAYAEARRLYDVVDRHFDRLGSIRTKLENLNGSVAPLEGITTGETSDRKVIRGATRNTAVPTTPTRLTLRLEPKKSASDRDLVDGQSPSTDNIDAGLQDVEKKPIPLRLKLTPTALKRGRKGRDLSEASTNEEINAIETSTRNALQMLKAPPEDAQIGGEHLPWLRLTEWELTRLRKRMKKNNTWQPSEVMVHRELAVRGRGWENYRRAKIHADETGEKFVDCDQIESNYKPGQSIQGREIQAGQETRLTNRGMKLNEAKKLKRENLAREAALAAAAAAEAAAAGSGDKTQSQQTTQTAPRSSRSRTNHVNANNNDQLTHSGDKMTRSRQASSAVTGRTAATGLSSNASQANRHSSKDRENRLTRKRKSEDLEPSIDFDHERASTTRASRKKIHTGEEFEAVDLPIDHRKAKNALSKQRQQSSVQTPEEKPGVSRAAATAGGRRNKRPAPGPVTSSQDGGTAVSVGRRKKKPAAARQSQRDVPSEDTVQQEAILDHGDTRIDEDGVFEQVDPNEPRYCICGDVSFGTMICCEDDNCDKEWFHLECVGLTEVPSRTAKWYCPECRTKIAKANADGIVRHGSRR